VARYATPSSARLMAHQTHAYRTPCLRREMRRRSRLPRRRRKLLIRAARDAPTRDARCRRRRYASEAAKEARCLPRSYMRLLRRPRLAAAYIDADAIFFMVFTMPPSHVPSLLLSMLADKPQREYGGRARIAKDASRYAAQRDARARHARCAQEATFIGERSVDAYVRARQSAIKRRRDALRCAVQAIAPRGSAAICAAHPQY